MSSAEQSNGIQSRINQVIQTAQQKAIARARELEQEARKILETLGDRAQAELKVRIAQAKDVSRDQLQALGVELEKLGKRLQDLAAAATPTPSSSKDKNA